MLFPEKQCIMLPMPGWVCDPEHESTLDNNTVYKFNN